MTRRFAIILLLAVFAGLGLARHQQPNKEASSGKPEDRAADRAAIHKTFQQLLKTLFTALLVREKEQWRLGQLREEERSEPVSLGDVKWLIGVWTAKTPDREVTITYTWDDRKVFIRGRFVVREKGKEVLSGQQII